MGEPVAPKKPEVADDEYKKEIEKARRELRALILNNKCAPLMLRLAWHDAATYDKETGTGGPDGSIRTEQELNYRANKGLREAVQLCEDVKAKLKKVSYADLYQLAGVVAVEVTGGPHIDFLPGRIDSDQPSKDNLLPDPKLEAPFHLRAFAERVGLTDQDIVALCGAHTLGKAHKDRSGFEGKWTEDPLKFDNSYFKKLKEKEEEEELLKLKKRKPLKLQEGELLQLKEGVLLEFKQGKLCEFKQGEMIGFKEGELLKLKEGELLELKEGELLEVKEGKLLEFNEEQLKLKEEELLKLPTDKALLRDKTYRSLVDDYEKSEEKFFQQYAVSHKKLTELGWDFKSGSEDNSSTSEKFNLPIRVIGIVVVSSTLIFGYLFKRKSIPRKTLESQN